MIKLRDYQPDDSEINFASGYVITEVEDHGYHYNQNEITRATKPKPNP